MLTAIVKMKFKKTLNKSETVAEPGKTKRYLFLTDRTRRRRRRKRRAGAEAKEEEQEQEE